MQTSYESLSVFFHVVRVVFFSKFERIDNGAAPCNMHSDGSKVTTAAVITCTSGSISSSDGGTCSYSAEVLLLCPFVCFFFFFKRIEFESRNESIVVFRVLKVVEKIRSESDVAWFGLTWFALVLILFDLV